MGQGVPEQLARISPIKRVQTWSDMVDVCRNLDTFTKASLQALVKP